MTGLDTSVIGGRALLCEQCSRALSFTSLSRGHSEPKRSRLSGTPVAELQRKTCHQSQRHCEQILNRRQKKYPFEVVVNCDDEQAQTKPNKKVAPRIAPGSPATAEGCCSYAKH